MMTLAATTIRDQNAKHGPEKTINLHYNCYFRSNSSQRGYRKRMIEIWQECASFQTTSQSLADQVRTIIKKGWFSDLEILEIHQKTLTQTIQFQTHQVVLTKNNIRNELPP